VASPFVIKQQGEQNMPRGIPGSGPYAKKNKTAKKGATSRKTKSPKAGAPKVAKKAPAKKGAAKKASKKA